MIYVIMMFMYIFAFRIPYTYDSTILLGIILTIKAIINARYGREIVSLLNSSRIKKIEIVSILIIFWGLLSQLVNRSADFNYIKTFFHLVISLNIGFMFIAFYEYKGITHRIVNDIILAFIAQSVLQWFFFLFPSISLMFNVLRNEDIAARNIIYSGYRGLAISSYGFFGLSSCYALALLLYASEYNSIFRTKYGNIVGFVLLASGIFFAGRTGYLGLLFIPLLFIKKLDAKIICRALVIICVVSLAVYAFWRLASQVGSFMHLYRFTFEPIINFINGKGFTATSTDSLLSMYNRKISLETFIVGDGKYYINGISYQHIDVGYLRKIFYFGMVGVAFSLVLEKYIIGKTINKRLAKLVFLMMMILELKGETIGMLISINSMMICASYCEKDNHVLLQS